MQHSLSCAYDIFIDIRVLARIYLFSRRFRQQKS
ncbi:hypothetical protein SLEP1_g25933 [Rubroshorea leprosula]|uniref:Uncharacterized protein n=1 Tax=Rubroshorea leprosula TaxID=152421 RepID=A0AAV5JW67_9ROSI|nr:hypothetical protein SLEP1_g25933 [Rubroshorea leprosula]